MRVWTYVLATIFALAALFVYQLTLATGAMDTMKAMLSSVSKDRRVLFLLIGYGFGNFMEGMAGFGTAVAIPTGILVAMGFDPVRTIVALLVVNTMPTAFGSVGVPTRTLAAVTGITDITGLSVDIVTIELLLSVVSPFLMIAIADGSAKALKGMIGIVAVSMVAFLVPAYYMAGQAGPELCDIVGSIFSMVGMIAFAMIKEKRVPVPAEYLVTGSAGGGTPKAESSGASEDGRPVKAEGPGVSAKMAGADASDTPRFDAKSGVIAWMPFILIFLFLLLTNLVAPIKEPLSKIATTVAVYRSVVPGETVGTLTFTWINTPGIIILVAGIIGGLVQGASLSAIFGVLLKTVKSNVKTVLTIVSVLATAKIMSHSGMTDDIANFFVATTGGLFPLFAPLIGMLGGFITGSGTSTCVLFGEMQTKTAAAIGASEPWLAAANVMGAGIGKMIAPQGIAIGTAAANLVGAENRILGKVLPYCLLYAAVGGLVCFFL
ncbi:MAG: L-lactate permease [Lachnospiraceae bacterium]|nr:L-lactate permease [Lachnospiraceae bacterium]